MIAADLVGIGSLVGTCGTVVIGIIVALRQQGTNGRVEQVHEAVKTSNGQTVGEIIEANEVRRTNHGATQ